MARLSLVPLFLAITVSLSPAAFAEERILLPVAVSAPVAGAFGSLWDTRLTVTNSGAAAVIVEGIDPGCTFGLCLEPADVPAGFTLFPRTLPQVGSPGVVLQAGAGSEQLSFALRVQDVSRQSQTWGTSIPVIRERDAFRSAFQLLDVPVRQSELRSLLRVYSFDGLVDTVVRMRVYATLPIQTNPTEAGIADELLAEQMLSLPRTSLPLAPGYAQLLLSTVSGVPDGARLRIELTPLDGHPIWAFVSVTNDDTQHVTAIVPNR